MNADARELLDAAAESLALSARAYHRVIKVARTIADLACDERIAVGKEADELVQFNPSASALAEAFWPGGLTLVLPRREPCPLALLVSADPIFDTRA